MAIRLEIQSIKHMSFDADLLNGKGPVEVLEFGANQLTVNLPTLQRNGVLVRMQLKLFIKAEQLPCAATGKVLQCSEQGQDGFRTVIHLSQIDTKLWNRFLKISKEKQGRADAIFSSIKGDDS